MRVACFCITLFAAFCGGAGVQSSPRRKKEGRHWSAFLFLAEKERFEFVCRRPIRLICLSKSHIKRKTAQHLF